MNASLRDSVRAGLGLPLLLVAFLAGGLGFLSARVVSDSPEPARLSVITTTGSVTPAPAADDATAELEESEESGGTGTRRRSCPSGCECSFPPNGLVVRCGGGNASVRTESKTQPQSGELPRQRFDLPAMD